MSIPLTSRRVIRVSGDDAADFLQNTLTTDIRALNTSNSIQYSLLLSPQGQILHDLFVVFVNEGEYLLDIYAPLQEDFMRRLTLFKLRAKVEITPVPDHAVTSLRDANLNNGNPLVFADPRHSELGLRCYGPHPIDAGTDEGSYLDLCIEKGVPPSQAIRFHKDFVHDLELQALGAVSWTKGCFIGQEVAARVEHRGLSKKGLYLVSCAQPVLHPDTAVLATASEGDEVIGEIRLASSDYSRALAVLKKAQAEEALSIAVAGHRVEAKNYR